MLTEKLPLNRRYTVFQDTLELGAACTFFKHHCAAVIKGPIVWAQGLLHLCLIFYHQSQNSRVGSSSFGHTMQLRFQSLGVNPMTYTWPWFQSPNAVYVKLEVDWRLFKNNEIYRQPSPKLYIGSTSISASLRESNRMSVFNKLNRNEEAQAELAIRYWQSQGNFERFSIIVLATFHSYRAAWISEHCFIDAWQPTLNYPFILTRLKRTALGFRPTKKRRRLTEFSTHGLRLWRKLRKRLFYSSQPAAFSIRRKQAWEILFDVASHTLASFRACTVLRSSRYVNDEVYAVIRLSLTLEEPLRSRTRQLLKQVANYRQMTWPSNAGTLSLQPMAHRSFSREIREWLKSQIRRYRHILVPFHLPSTQIREAPHRSLLKCLHNTSAWDEWLCWHSLADLPCCCDGSIFADATCMIDGHIACGLEQLALHHPWMEWIGNCSATSTVFPGKTHFFRRNLLVFSKWRQKQSLPPSVETEFEQLLLQQWKLHYESLIFEPRLTWQDVQKTRNLLDFRVVIHNEDHHNSHLMIYCPRFYYESVFRTWDDPDVFQPLEGSPEEWQRWVTYQVPSSLATRYHWGFTWGAQLPRGFVFLKRKKRFKKGRTIISYSNSLMKKLLKAASQVISLLLQTVWVDGLGMYSLPRLWQELHQFLRTTHPSVHLFEANDDLIGFFNSVPRSDILQALRQLLADYGATHEFLHVSTTLSRTAKHDKALPGKPRGGSNAHAKSVRLSDVPKIVELSFELGIFQTAGRVYRQIRGTCIGNQISPVLSSLPVILKERTWLKSWHTQGFFQKFLQETRQVLLFRYADNRLILASHEAMSHPVMKEFLQPSFYGGSIELESVQDHKWLGFQICAHDRSAMFVLPDKPWMIKHPQSAGSWRLMLSSYNSRKALIRKYAWPPAAKASQLHALRQLYIDKGYPSALLL